MRDDEADAEERSPVQGDFDAATRIGTITFNRPSRHNALDLATAEAFESTVARIVNLPRVRCVVLTGSGRAFMAGGDIAAFAADLDNSGRTLNLILKHMHPALHALREMDAPVLAAVNGVAAGAGLSLVLAADYVVAKQSARFVLAYDKLGTVPDCGGSWFLSRKLGRTSAFELMLERSTLSASEAKELSLVNRVVEDDLFPSAVRELALKIASGPTRAFGMFKTLMDADLPLAAHMELERKLFVAAMQTEDFRSAATAFVQKRSYSHQGR